MGDGPANRYRKKTLIWYREYSKKAGTVSKHQRFGTIQKRKIGHNSDLPRSYRVLTIFMS